MNIVCKVCLNTFPIECFPNYVHLEESTPGRQKQGKCRYCCRDQRNNRFRLKHMINSTAEKKSYEAAKEFQKAKRSELLSKLIKKFGKSCAYCNIQLEENEMQIDHVMPKCQGGSDTFDNLALSCKRCNNAKWDTSLYAFRLWLDHVRSKDFKTIAL